MLGAFLAVAVAGTFVLVALAAAAMPRVSPDMVGPVRISSVSYGPENPAPGEPMTVTAQIAGAAVGPLSVNFQYASYFASVGAGGGPMFRVGPRLYETRVSGFPGGTEVWFVVAASAPGMTPVVSQSFTIDIGSVPRDGASGLRIVDAWHTPDAPRSFESVTIEATVTSTAAIDDVSVAYMAFCPNTPPGGIDPPMSPVAPNHYTFALEPLAPCGFAPSTVYLYRVLAVDSTGNTAVSATGTIRF
jgi:hypothetical protein